METLLYLASILGPLLFVIWIWLLLNAEMYKKMIHNFLSESIAIYASAVWGFVVGLLMIQKHNIWEFNWALIITLLGWLIFVKSALLLTIPRVFEDMVKQMKFSNGMIQGAGVFYILIWLFFIFKAF